MIEIFRMIPSSYYPDPAINTCDRRKIRSLVSNLLSSLWGVGIVFYNNIIKNSNITMKTSDACGETCRKDCRVSDDTFFTAGVVYRNFCFSPFLTLGLIYMNHIWPVLAIDGGGKNVLDELKLFNSKIRC